MRFKLFLAATAFTCASAFADSTPQALPFSQDWSNVGLITVNDNWSGVPGIEGYLGQELTAATGVDPQTVTGTSAIANDLDVTANQTNPSTFASGGATEFEITNPVVGIAGSGTADAPYLLIHLNTTGQQSINVAYNLRDIDGSVDNSVQPVALQYRVGNTGAFTNVPSGFVADASSGPSLATLVTPVSAALPAAANNQPLVQVRVITTNAVGNDEYIGIDDISITAGLPPALTLSINDASVTEGNIGTTTATFTVSLTQPAGAGGVTFDIATADGTATVADNDYVARSLTGQTIAQGANSYTFDVTVNGDTTPEPNETFFVNVTNIVGATAGDAQGVGTILNDDAVPITLISAVQGTGVASPLVGQTVTIEGIVVGSYQAQTAGQLRGFFVQEENSDADADPLTSEGLFVFCSACPVAVVEGQRVQVTGAVSEFFNMTQITASTAQSVVVVDAGNNLALATASDIDLPIAGDTAAINAFYEAREGMRVRFTDVLSVSEYFELARYGQLILYANARPFQFTEDNAPSVSGFAAHITGLAGRRVILDDTDNRQNVSIDPPDDGTQRIYHPIANGGLSTGTQGADFFRGGDTVSNLTGVLHWSFAGQNGTDAWRIRPTQATPATFTPVNTRAATAPDPTGLIKVASVNVLNFFTTIDTNTATCGPAQNQSCRGADSAQELVRQRDRTTTALCGLDADLIGLVEIENTPGSNAITTVRDDLNARCGGTNPWAIAGTDGTIGSDAIRGAQIYRSGRLNPVGSPLLDADPIHNRPPMAQTYELVGGPQAGQRFTAVVNHFKSKGCGGATGLDLDQLDGQGCFAATRASQASRLLTWVTADVIPAAGNDPDVLLLGDFNSYGSETAIQTIRAGGYIDLLQTFEPDGYTYLFNGQLGNLDYVFASASIGLQVMGAAVWHINADEVPLFDYNDDIRDLGESAFEEEPNGALRMPPRLLYAAATPFRASDHDPIVVGVFGLPPTISAIADRTGLQDTPITGITFTIADPDGMANVTCGANVVVTSSNQTLLPNANIAISGAAQVCSLTLTPAAGASGTTTITVRVTDASGLSVEETFDATFLSDLLFRDGFEPQSPAN